MRSLYNKALCILSIGVARRGPRQDRKNMFIAMFEPVVRFVERIRIIVVVQLQKVIVVISLFIV